MSVNANRLSSTISGNRETILHDVTSVKYNMENEIFSHNLTCFPRFNKKKFKTENKEHIKLQLFYCKISFLF